MNRVLSVVRALAWLCALALVLIARASRADDLDDVRQRGVLVWGADQEGGGPYVYAEGDELKGFEVELAAELARELGVRSEFFQGNWDKLPDLLRTDRVDIVLNGYEWSPDRAREMAATIPYCVYGLQLLVKKGSSVAAWGDLRSPSSSGDKRKVGALTGSAAEEYLREHWAASVEVVGYDGNTDAMKEVENEKLDATLQDTPIVAFYAPQFPELLSVGDRVGAGYYVVFAKAGEDRLVRALDEALVRLILSGKIERLYRKYGMWSDEQRDLGEIARAGRFYGFVEASMVEPAAPDGAEEAPPIVASERPRGLAVARKYGVILLQAAGMTILLSVVSFPIAALLGLFVALGRLYGPAWVSKPLGVYVEVLRGTPLMLQLYFVFFVLPEVGIRLPAFATAVAGLAINYSAYEAEIYRAGLQAVPHGQLEAALSLGMSRGTALQRIIVPQATRIVVPPVVNDFIALFKDTSVCSVITIVELTKRYSVLSQSTQATVELMAMTAVLYLAMSYPLAIVSRRLEHRLRRSAAE